MDLLGRTRTRGEFERFVAEQSDSLLRTAYLIAWDLGEAEELVQECLLQVARRWPRVRKMEHPQAYARRVLSTLALKGSRRRARRALELAARPGPGADEASFEPLSGQSPPFRALAERQELFAALATLSQRQRLVLALRYFADLSETQTAEALGCSVGTVKSTTSRALAQLRREADSRPVSTPCEEPPDPASPPQPPTKEWAA